MRELSSRISKVSRLRNISDHLKIKRNLCYSFQLTYTNFNANKAEQEPDKTKSKCISLTITAVTLSSCCRLHIVTATPLMMGWWWNLLLLRRARRCAPTLRVVLSGVPSSISTSLRTSAPALILLHHVSWRSHWATHHRSTHLSIRATHRPHIPRHAHWRPTRLRWTPLTLMTVVHFTRRVSWFCTLDLNLKSNKQKESYGAISFVLSAITAELIDRTFI